MIVYIRGHSFRYEMENIARLFTGEVTVSTERPVPAGDFAYLRAACAGGRMRLLCYVSVGGDRGLLRRTAPMEDSRAQEYELAGMLYDLLSARFGVKPPWGILTGIRPAKYVSSRREALGSWDAVRSELTGRCHVTGAKTELAIATAIHSQAVRALSRPDSVSLYISIPFCPTRCSYCSFVSKTTERDGGRQLESYVNCLVREIGQALAVIRRLGLRLETVYIGGGTPTVMTAEQLARVLEAVSAGAELAGVREFTVEAGRPDTIDREKLLLLKGAGVSRICINPQTFSDEVLRAIGRRHTAADIDRVFAEARALGFSNINMDLIAGLPGDTAEGFRRSLDRVSELAPEGVTVHALTIKRASTLREKGGFTASPASAMVDDAYRTLTENGYVAYYMYRQKGTVDNLENVGYSRPGYFGLYNVFIMDELHTIMACGAGAVTKLVNPFTHRISRIFNYKYPAEYIDGFEEMLRRKNGVEDFYAGCVSSQAADRQP